MPDNRINVVWTGLNRFAVSPQIDPYTGGLHDGYAQDAMFARRQAAQSWRWASEVLARRPIVLP